MELDKKISKFKLILTSLCCLVWLCCFCNADSFAISWLANVSTNSTIGSNNYNILFRSISSTWSTWNYYMCISDTYYNWSISYDIYFMECNWNKSVSSNLENDSDCTKLSTITKASSQFSVYNSDMTCFSAYSWKYYYFSRFQTWGSSQLVLWVSFLNTDVLESKFWNSSSCPSCPSQYTSLECQQEYSLIPVSSVDQNYCVSNNLCPASEGGECESWSVNWSALYINNVQHLGGAIIRVDIPEEIERDYTQGTGEFDLDVVGYNVDYEAIQNKIDIQNYKPSQEDFNNVIWVLAWYMPLIVILIWFVVILALIKKPFKSKL